MTPTVPEELTITAGGSAISGWEEIEVTLRAEGFPPSFAIAMSSQRAADAVAIAGAACTVSLSSDVVITGYIDRDTPSYDGTSHRIELQGRGKTQDLVDCSAEWPTGQLTNVDALEIARTLAKPYGLTVKLGAGAAAGDKVPQWNLNYGETGAAIVQRVAVNAGLLAYEDRDGALLLATVGAVRAASGLTYGQNVQAFSIEHSMDGRFSTIVCCSEAMDLLQDVDGKSDFYHSETDPNVPRHRQLDLTLEAVATDPQAFTIKKAVWEMARRAGRSTIVHATVDSWRDSAGTLWAPNTLVPVDLPGLRLTDTDLCVAEATFRRNNETGTTADLVLMPKLAFALEPVSLQPVNLADVKGADE